MRITLPLWTPGIHPLYVLGEYWIDHPTETGRLIPETIIRVETMRAAADGTRYHVEWQESLS